jgi:hypothetical protein
MYSVGLMKLIFSLNPKKKKYIVNCNIALTTLWIGGQDRHPVSGSIPESAVKNTNSKNI